MGGIGPAVPSQALPQQNYQNNTYNPPTNFAAGAIGPANPVPPPVNDSLNNFIGKTWGSSPNQIGPS